jgi:hypothetical protein
MNPSPMRPLPHALACLALLASTAPAATNAEKAKATANAVAAGGGTAGSATAGAKVAPAKPATAPSPGEIPTPLTEPLKDGTETRITCAYKGAGKFAALSGTYHYVLRIPEGYSADARKTWKSIFIADPNGKARLGAMADWVKAHGYVAIMLEESRNGPWEPILGNFLAAHEDVVRRVRLAEGRKVATGFSGGARASSTFVTLAPGFGGLILQGAGCAEVNPTALTS